MANQNLRVNITAFDKTQRAFSSVRRGLGSVKKTVFNVKTAVAGLAGAAGFGLFIKSTIETNRKFQSLEASLKTFLGSSKKAAGAFDVLQQFAAQTPFSLQEVVGGFNRLISVGLNPSISALEAFGNIASGTGKTLEQFVEAAADAAVGEFERLKEFGIKARSEGDKVVFTFKGVETEIKKDAASIEGYLRTLGQTEFAGAIAEQSKTLNGAFSNLRDSFESFQKKLGEAGFNEAITKVAKNLSKVLSNGDELAELLGEKLAQGIEGAYQGLLSLITGTIGFGVALNEAKKGNIRFVDVISRTRAEMVLMRKAIDDAMASATNGVPSVKELDDKLENITETSKEVKRTLGDMLGLAKDEAKKTGDVIGDSFGDAFTKLSEGTMSAKDAFKSMAQDIIKQLYQIFVVEKLVNSISSGITSFFSPTPKKAIGGSVQRGQPTLVGERGAEMFIPASSGSIVPNNQLGGDGGATVVQNINISTGVSQTVRAEITQLMPQIAEASKAAVLDARRRGGSFSKAF
jgi:hypothetical protein